jgi:hypothetical protein
MNLTSIHFFDQPIEPIFDTPPAREKSPDCPKGFTWEDKTYRVTEMLSSWSDFTRRGKMARNMQPQHAATASRRGTLNVGRFYFRVRVVVVPAVQLLEQQNSAAGQSPEQIFDIYYDRAMKNVDKRKGQWFVYRELGGD